MKTLIAAALLLALTSSAHASKLRESDRKWVPTVNIFVREAYGCLRGWDEDEPRKEAACKTMDKLMDKLYDHGYCYQGMGGIGRPSKDRKHCYTISWPLH
jgi:hypothetical protein